MKKTISAKNFSFYLFYLLIVSFCCLSIEAQFNSGSTGADGAFNPPDNQTTIVTLPESGILNYTTINISTNALVKFTRNSQNTPVIILATGDVNISGRIEVVGEPAIFSTGGLGGPGGFNGGDGGFSINQQIVRGKNGEGPGGGGGGGDNNTARGMGGSGGFSTNGGTSLYSTGTPQYVNGIGGSVYGLRTLVPLIGGSGGGGSSSAQGSNGFGGGGGGGAILLASSTQINFAQNGNLLINARGGNCTANDGVGGSLVGGNGSGGSIRLISNKLNGQLRFRIDGANGCTNSGRGGDGYLRIEAYDLTGFNLVNSGSGGLISRSTPKAVFPANQPTLRITSVAGLTAPAQPKGSFQEEPDIIIPTTQTNPANVALSASGIPLGTTIRIILTPETGDRISAQSTPLSGTIASSTANASISIPNGISIIHASATIELPSSGAKAMFINGENVDRIELSATFGGKTKVTYILKSGKQLVVNQ